jgi:hypothetical protein
MNSSPATSQMPATGGRFGVCLLPYPRREISWGERHPLRREACAARGVHFDHAHVIRLADSQPKNTVLCGHTCGGNPASLFSSAKHVARALARQDNELGAILVPRLMRGHEAAQPVQSFPCAKRAIWPGRKHSRRADQPGPKGAVGGTQVSQRGSNDLAYGSEALAGFVALCRRRPSEKSVGGFVVSRHGSQSSRELGRGRGKESQRCGHV